MNNTKSERNDIGTPLSLEQLSAMDQTGFTAVLADIFEHSPWVAHRVWHCRPFSTLEALHQAMVQEVHRASANEQVTLIRAHPELAGKQAREGTLTTSSAQEQRGAGLDQCSAEELQRLNTLNARYRDRFRFPFIIAVKGLDRYQIMGAMEARLSSTPEQEHQTCLQEIAKIAHFRLEALITH